MKIAFLITLTGAVVISLHSLTFAAPGETPNLDKRQTNQQKRIQQGVKSGQLTPEESARLNNQQERIQKAEDAAKSDGKVTRQEQNKLKNMQENASKDIYNKKHNKKKAGQLN